MAFKTFLGYVRLSRPVNVAITLIAIPVACWLTGITTDRIADIVLAALTGAFVAAGANAINDYFDIEIDRINKPNRPLPAGVLSAGQAKKMWLLTSAVGIGLNLFLNTAAFIIACAAVMALYFYSSYFKKTVLWGNVLVGVMTGMAFIYGGAVAGSMRRAVFPALFAFLSNFGREVIKDMEDLKGDEAKGAMTFPIRYGIQPAGWVVVLTMLLLVLSTTAAILWKVYSFYFVCIVIPLDIVFLFIAAAIWISTSERLMHRLSTVLKICMMLGLLGIIAGSY
ncbi:MAG: geranylgeranylglycerol-phosphate geranylgeranyltransferase [Bacteroidota bacterium]